MNLKKFAPWILILFLVLGLALAGFFVLSNQTTIKPNNVSVAITNKAGSEQYQINPNSTFQVSSLVNSQKEIIVNNDPTPVMAWFGKPNESKLSGFSYEIEGESLKIQIYLKPNVPEEERLAEINRNYIAALIFAEESLERPEAGNIAWQKVYQAFDLIKTAENYPIVKI